MWKNCWEKIGDTMNEMKIGIQLYTIREPLQQDFKGVMRDLAELGCDGVEFAFYFGGLEPEELAAFMQEVGIVTCGMHVHAKDFDQPDNRTFDYARALGCRYVTISHGGPFRETLPAAIQVCAKAGREAASQGFTFTYHNHAAEFELIDGEYALDRLFQQTDPIQVQAELDVYWIAKGGEDPVKYINKYADRLPQIHMKDMDRETGVFTELGQGCIDLQAVVDAARKTVCQWLIYEQDVCQKPQFESAKISLEYLRKINQR